MQSKKNNKTKSRPLENKISTPSSSTTVSISYSEDSQILKVVFKPYHVYRYQHVEPKKWLEYKKWVEDGKSSGEFVNRYIKPFYDVVESINDKK